MSRVSSEVIIEATPEEIWQFVGDPVKEMAWRKPGLRDLELLDEKPVDVGSRYRGRTRYMGRENRYTNVITTFDPPRRVAWDWVEASGPLAASGYYELRALGEDETRFRITLDYRPTNLLGRLIVPVVDLFAGRVLQRFAMALKAKVESGEGLSDPTG